MTTFDGLICLSPDPWEDVKRPRQLMSRLADHVPVVYVEPPAYMPAVLRVPFSSAEARARVRRAVTGRGEEPLRGVHVVTPAALLPDHRLRSLPAAVRTRLRAHTQRQAEAAGRREAGRLGMSRPAWWIAEPRGVPEGDGVVVYDCLDRWRDFPGAARDPWWRGRIVEEEELLLERADAVFCSAEGLRDTVRLARGRVELLRNGADFEHFGTDAPMPAELADLPRPILGYVGAVAQWVDLSLVAEVAALRPDWSVVLVGPLFAGALSGRDDGLERLRDIANVHLLGPRPYADMPAFVRAFDVALIPFERDALTADTNPIKLYEYLAAGAPVVSTTLPEVEGVEGVLTADDAAGFVAMSERAIAERGEEAAARRRAVAREESWDARAAKAWEVLGALPTEKPRPRVLAIGTDVPWPLDSGYRIRAFENLRALSETAEVTLVTFGEGEDAVRSAEALRETLPIRVQRPVPHRIHIRRDPPAVALALAAGIATGKPYKVQKFSSREMRRRTRALARAVRFDAAHVELATWQYVGAARVSAGGLRTVLDEHNVEWALLAEQVRLGRMVPLSALLRLESARTRRYEARVCSTADGVIAISPDDARRIAALRGSGEGVFVVPPVAPHVPGPEPGRAEGGHLLMVGQLSWLPNEQAVRWFCEEVLPLVRESLPDVRLQVVGGGASAALRTLMEARGVDAFGYVEDLGACFAGSAVYVAPFTTGGGVRIKLLEAMARGIPLVSTRVGALGLSVRDGEELLLADSAPAFAEAVCRVLHDRALAAGLADSARAYVLMRHGAHSAAEEMRRAYATVFGPPPLEPSAEPMPATLAAGGGEG